MASAQPSIHQILRETFGHPSFRPSQEAIIRSVLDNQDTLALLPTGGGKSLCYQVPVLARDGIGLVISPLIALMRDQVDALRRKNITAFAIYSGMGRPEVINVLRLAAASNCKFLYVSPERLETALFLEYLPALRVSLVAVDEAHCVSQWGYDFRPAYLRIAALREHLPDTPLLALTASATPEVQEDICAKLSFRGRAVFRQSFARPNLSYRVLETSYKPDALANLLGGTEGSALVYCSSRKRTGEVASRLNQQQIRAVAYHAGLGREQRHAAQQDWIQGRTRVIACTNAFGMGIDKPDVRTVIHMDPPDSLESYYQESGRAGRDGLPAQAIVLYSARDLTRLEELPSLRYPPLETIRTVYQAIANYLQLPSGAGEGQYYDFDLDDFTRRFALNAYAVSYSLKTLEQEGWLSFQTQSYLPASAGFTAGRRQLEDWEKSNPALQPLIHALLRRYPGIFDFPVPISESNLARQLRLPPEQVAGQLATLQRYGLLTYRSRKEGPQLLLLRNRIPVSELRLDEAAYRQRQERFRQRLRHLMDYLADRKTCRSRLITAYFGEPDQPDCGHCDTCRNRPASTASQPRPTC
ncbi:MAG TPA: ATP-dependent DNA helicase RecQ [Chitinophagaceae bacterium]|nr:ATP-dependent DNA helicase RecQ [Chitinophagaceae bacterium]